jgi:hypothetical protein
MDAARVFSEIYATDAWSGGSGPGSTPDFCRPLVEWLADFVDSTAIHSVVDFGCGDFQWMPEVLERTGVGYVGLDVVPGLIASHRARFPRWSFDVLDASTVDLSVLPNADLYWSKDVMQHWPDEAIAGFLDRFFAARPGARLVVCNCRGQRPGPRQLDRRWHFAPLDGDREPLAAWSPVELFAWRGKAVYLLHQRSVVDPRPTSLEPAAWPQSHGETA